MYVYFFTHIVCNTLLSTVTMDYEWDQHLNVLNAISFQGWERRLPLAILLRLGRTSVTPHLLTEKRVDCSDGALEMKIKIALELEKG